jgi:hypothetical protein
MRTALALLLLAALLLPTTLGAEENTLQQSVQVGMLVADPDQAGDRIEGWAEAQGGYLLEKSSERVVLRLPLARLPLLRGFLEGLSEDILAYAPQAEDLREQLSQTRSGLRSRQEILKRNLALLDQADAAGTLAIEQELLSLIEEVEGLQARLAALSLDQQYARVEIALSFRESPLPRDIPSSFGWINKVSFYALVEEGF